MTKNLPKVISQPLEEAKQQIQLIQHAMKDIMIPDQHYGKIPGCGAKDCLLKAGAEKLCLLFGFRMVIDPEKDITIKEDGAGHKEYRVTCHLFNKKGEEQATGVGLCSTMESKYAFRTKWENGTKRQTTNPNIADTYNTVLKMAKKRAHVDATITACGASDIFTQDIEEMDGINRKDAVEAEVVPEDKKEQAPAHAVGGDKGGGARAAQEQEEKKEKAKPEQLHAILDWTKIDSVTPKAKKDGTIYYELVCGDVKLFGNKLADMETLIAAKSRDQMIKARFDNSGKQKILIDVKVK